MRVMLFAGLAEVAGRRELSLALEAGGCTVAELEQRLRQECPALGDRPFRVALNQSYARADDVVSDTDEVALIPPVSGG